MHVLLVGLQVWAVLNRVPRWIELTWNARSINIVIRLIVIMQVQLIPRITRLNDLKSEAYSRPVVRNAIVRMLQIIIQKFSIVELDKGELIEHVGSVLLLLFKDELELSEEVDFNPMVVLDVSYVCYVSRLSLELWLVWIKWIPPWRVLITVLWIEKLRVALIKVINDVLLSDIREVKELF